MAKESREVSLALAEADAAITILAKLIDEPVLDTQRKPMMQLIQKARAALDRAQALLGDARTDLQRQVDKL
jgi:hypothetical protein